METKEKVNQLLESNSVKFVAELIGISTPTLYRKLQLNTWSKAEIFLIKHL